MYQGFRLAKSSGVYRNDCTVKSLAEVTGLDYFVVFERLRLAGRTNNSAFAIDWWLKSMNWKAMGFAFEKRACLQSKGKFLCWNATHAWATVDGILVDSWKHNPKPKAVFLVVPTEVIDPNLAKAKALAEVFYGD